MSIERVEEDSALKLQLDIRNQVMTMQQRYFETVRATGEQMEMAQRFPSRDAIMHFLNYSLHHTAARFMAILHNRAFERLGLLTEETMMQEPPAGTNFAPMVVFTQDMTSEVYLREILKAYDIQLAAELSRIAGTQGWDAQQLCYSLSLPSPLETVSAPQDTPVH